MKNLLKKLFFSGSVFLFCFNASLHGVVVNRVNGGMNAVYVDFSLPGLSVPLEVIRTYNSITAINEATAWPGSFGWGWTSPFETTLTITAERNAILRDGGTGNTLYFKPEKEDPATREQFIKAVTRAYYESKSGRVISEDELKTLKLPEKMAKQIKSSAQFRAEVASKYQIQVTIPKGELLVSNEYAYQTLTFKNNQWIREKEGLLQIFDKEGRIIKHVDKNNTTFNFVYSSGSKSQLTEVHEQNKASSIKLSWRQDRVVQIVDNKGLKAKYAYDNNGNLISATDSTGQVFNYKYENKKFPHLITQIVYVSESSSNRTVTRDFRYDENGLVIYQKEKEGVEISYAYGRNAADPENNFTTKVTFKNKGVTLEEMDEFFIKNRPDGSKYLHKHDSKGATGSLVTTFTPCCGKPSQIVRNGETTNFQYDTEGFLTEKVGPSENLKIEYNPKWKKISKVVQNGLTSTFEYDSRGNLIRAANSRKEQVSLKYDRYGKITEMTDGNSNLMSFKYGPIGKPTFISQKGVGTVLIEYDKDGTIVKTETLGPEKTARRPTQNSSQDIARKVMKNFQNLLNVLRPAGISTNG
jgi:YD repeat-containing protein